MIKKKTNGSGSPGVAVVIPYYNGSKYIERAVESVLDQTVKPVEFVVVSDGSSEAETEFLRKLSKRRGFRIIEKENGGQGSARNAGVAATAAPYICFLDQDDYYLKTHIETLIDAMPVNDPHLGWVYGDLFEADGDGNISKTSMIKDYSDHPKTNIYAILGRDMFVLPSASLISRAAFESVGGFDPQFMGYEDDDLFLRMFRKGFTNYYVDRPVTVWCIHPDSTSYGIRMSRSRLRYFKKLALAFPDNRARSIYYLRDILIPRFHSAFIGEVANANDGLNPKRFGVLGQHRKELLSILQEYRSIVEKSDSVSVIFKLKLMLQYRLLSMNSRIPVVLARKGLTAARLIRAWTRR